MRASQTRLSKKLGLKMGLQFAALPYRNGHGGELEILLVTSRETRRWVLPKGWPMKSRAPHEAAAREAFEEAGVVGVIAPEPVGAYSYVKQLDNGAPLTCTVQVFTLAVSRQRRAWPEMAERRTHWWPLAEAADLVWEPDLADLIRAFGVAPPPPTERRRKSGTKRKALKL